MADLPLPTSGSPIALLDLGSSEGANAIHAVGAIIEALRERTSADIWTFFDDLPTNDFNRLFANLFPDAKRSSRPPGIYPAAVGGSLFERVAPASSLHVATTFNAVGWMSALPATRLPQFISPSPPTQRASREGVSVTPEQRAPFAQQAREDILSFYRARECRVPFNEELYGRMANRFAGDPERYEFHFISLGALLTRLRGGASTRVMFPPGDALSSRPPAVQIETRERGRRWMP